MFSPFGNLKEVSRPWEKLREVTTPGKTRRMQIGLLLAFLAIIGFPSLTGFLERGLLDFWLDFTRFFRPPFTDILIVGIDADTLAFVPERWPWPRRRFAEMAEILASGSPRALIWDLALDHLEAEGGSDGDKRLASAFRRVDHLALVSTMEMRNTPEGIHKRLFRSDPVFRETADSEGFAYCPVDPDGVFRRFVIRDGTLGCDASALQVFKALRGEFSESTRFDDLGFATSFLAFASKGGEIPSVRAVDLLRGDVKPDILNGKVLVFGPTAPVLQDFHPTSRGLLAGPRILATSLDTLLNMRCTVVADGLIWRALSGILGAGAGLVLSSVAASHPILWSGAWLSGATVLWGAAFVFLGVHFPWGILAACWSVSTLAQSGLRDFLRYVDERTHLAEAQAAARIQAQLFPAKPWERGEFRIQGFCQPSQAAGGDFYDFLPMSQGRLMFIIADVTGHGIPAAMVTCMVKALSGMLVEFDQVGPEEFSRYVNSFLFKTFKGKRLMTAMIGILHASSNRVSLLNAGQSPAYLVHADGRVEELGKPSLPLGVRFDRSVDHFQAIAMAPGDHLVLSTDGIPEAVDWEGRQYGYDAWARFLGSSLPGFPENAPLSGLLDGVRSHAAGRTQDDDVTVVVLRRKPSQNDSKGDLA